MAGDVYRKKERVGWVGVNTLQREVVSTGCGELTRRCGKLSEVSRFAYCSFLRPNVTTSYHHAALTTVEATIAKASNSF